MVKDAQKYKVSINKDKGRKSKEYIDKLVKDAQRYKVSINKDKERKSKEFINKMVKDAQTFKVSINKNKERKSKKFINKMVKDAQTSKVSTYQQGQEQGQGQEKDEYRVGLKIKNRKIYKIIVAFYALSFYIFIIVFYPPYIL